MRAPRFVSVLSASLLLAAPAAQAETFKEMLDQILPAHARVKAAEADVDAAKNLEEVARGGWYPTLTATVDYGREHENKPGSTLDTNMMFKRYEAQIKQLVWDFGATNAAIDRSEYATRQAELVREGARQALVLDALTAYINLVRAHKQLAFARESEANIRKQTGLEQARVARGSGLSTDVLQAKAQLAGAEATRVAAEGMLATASNRFRAVFGADPKKVSTLEVPRIPADLLPKALPGAMDTARDANVRLKIAQAVIDIARASADATKASSFYPRVDLIGEARDKQNYQGTAGNQVEKLVKVQASMPFNLGFTAINSLKAADSAIVAANARLDDTRDLVEEEVRNAWDNLATQRARADYLSTQADIAAEFLELARKERTLGTRSLIDVLTGETTLINANSAAASAEADVAIAAYTLLSAMGTLDEKVVR